MTIGILRLIVQDTDRNGTIGFAGEWFFGSKLMHHPLICQRPQSLRGYGNTSATGKASSGTLTGIDQAPSKDLSWLRLCGVSDTISRRAS